MNPPPHKKSKLFAKEISSCKLTYSKMKILQTNKNSKRMYVLSKKKKKKLK